MANKLKVEQELERVINDNRLETNDKVLIIKRLLIDVSQIELSFEKWERYITGDEIENNDNKN